MISIQKLDHIGITVKDLYKSVDWYSKVLGLEQWESPEWGEVPVFMLAKNKSGIALFPAAHDNPPSANKGAPHFAFQVDQKGFEDAKAHLSYLRVDWDFQDHDESHSIYFRDPDNYLLEITTYDI